MANNTGWIAGRGQGLTFGGISFTAGDLNSLASGGGALGTTVVANGSTTLDQYADFSFVVTVGGTTVAGSYITLFLLPLNQDGTTYGDGYASSSSTQAAAGYAIGSINVKVGVTTGNTVTGQINFVNLPPGSFKIAFGNNLQIALSSTAALTLAYRSYNVSLNS
jgi:hypothetical protein